MGIVNVNERLKKALGDSAAGSILRQDEVNRIIAEIVDFENPFRQNLPRRPGVGQNVVLNRRTPGTTVGGFVADTDTSFNHSDGAYTQVTFPYKILLKQGTVSSLLIAQGASYIDVLQQEIESSARDLRDFEDNALFTGSVSSIRFDSLQTLITREVVMAATSVGAALTLKKIDELVDNVQGRADMLVTSRRTRRDIFGLLLGATQVVEVRGGFRLGAYADIPIFVSTNIVDTMVANADGTHSSNTGGALSEIFAINTEQCWVSVLKDLTFADANASTNNVQTFEIFEYLVPVLHNTNSCSRLSGIAAVT